MIAAIGDSVVIIVISLIKSLTGFNLTKYLGVSLVVR